jgi:hypothetical protein
MSLFFASAISMRVVRIHASTGIGISKRETNQPPIRVYQPEVGAGLNRIERSEQLTGAQMLCTGHWASLAFSM